MPHCLASAEELMILTIFVQELMIPAAYPVLRFPRHVSLVGNKPAIPYRHHVHEREHQSLNPAHTPPKFASTSLLVSTKRWQFVLGLEAT